MSSTRNSSIWLIGMKPRMLLTSTSRPPLLVPVTRASTIMPSATLHQSACDRRALAATGSAGRWRCRSPRCGPRPRCQGPADASGNCISGSTPWLRPPGTSMNTSWPWMRKTWPFFLPWSAPGRPASARPFAQHFLVVEARHGFLQLALHLRVEGVDFLAETVALFLFQRRHLAHGLLRLAPAFSRIS